MQTMQEFIAKHKIEMGCMPRCESGGWYCEFRKPTVTRMDTLFFPDAVTESPDMEQLLSSMGQNSRGAHLPFPSWCYETGREEDSHSLQLYDFCRAQMLKLVGFLGDKAYRELVEDVEDEPCK